MTLPTSTVNIKASSVFPPCVMYSVCGKKRRLRLPNRKDEKRLPDRFLLFTWDRRTTLAENAWTVDAAVVSLPGWCHNRDIDEKCSLFPEQQQKDEEEMRTNQVKAKLKRGEAALGAWLSLPDVSAARIMARLGFDWLVVDMEHSAHNAALMGDMVGAIADAGTCAPIVRVPGYGVEWFKW